MRRSLPVLAVGLFIVSGLIACSGANGYTPAPSSSTVNFLFIVPSASTSATTRKTDIITPSNAVSASITLDSIDGAAPATASTTLVALNSSAPGCQQTTAQLSCTASVHAPPGALVFTIKLFASGSTVVAAGDVSVTAAAGQTENAPLTLGGSVASLAIAVGAAEQQSALNVPVTLQAKDADGNTIIGTYNEPIAVSDADSSGQTSLSATSIPDSTTAASLTLDYLGGTMSSPATISASGTGLATVSTTFLPDNTYPTVNGNAVTESYTTSYSYWAIGQPTSGPYSYSGSYTETYLTGQTFNGVNDAIAISDGGSSDYYVWTSGANGAAQLGYLGYGYSSGTSSQNETCAPPYDILFEAPIPSSWNVYAGSGACGETYSYAANPTTDFENQKETVNADGSYSYAYTFSDTSGGGAADYGSGSASLDASGNATIYDDTGNGSDAVTLTAPAANAASMPVSYVLNPSGTFPPSTPAPTVTTAPNPFLASGADTPTGTVLSPLLSDVFTSKGSIAATALPSSCSVPSSILPSTSTLSHIQEVYAETDPTEANEDLYYRATIDHYYLPGVGDVCDVYNETEFDYDDDVIDWVDGTDQTLDTELYSETDSITSTDLTAALAHRDMTKVLSSAAALFEAASRTHANTLRIQHLTAIRQARMQHKRGPVPMNLNAH